AIPILINYIKSTDNLIGRKRTLHILKKIPTFEKSILVDELMGNTSADEKKRIIEALHDFADIDITDCLRYFLRHHSADIRKAMIDLIIKRQAEKTVDLVLEILKDKKTDENIDIIKDAIFALGNMKAKKAVPYLIKLIKKICYC
ncbi:MAG: hypothetical protein ABIK49_00750, partial [candidate division WOR-3 bacterium]